MITSASVLGFVVRPVAIADGVPACHRAVA
jgi:hypothetical protein